MRRVALLLETSREYGRGLLRGVSAYVHEHRSWSLYFQPDGLNRSLPSWINQWKGDGILVRLNDPKAAEWVYETGLPAIDLRDVAGNNKLPAVGPDNPEVARMAAEHFLERGFRHFGFCGMPIRQYHHMDVRRNCFRELVEKAGCSCSIYELRHGGHLRRSWDKEQDRLSAWLKSLPTPAAVMACNDDYGNLVLDACQRSGLLVPDHVAVMGVDDDKILCTLSEPPLSSVNPNLERIGYQSALLLDQMMDGAPPPQEFVAYSPLGITERQSSDTLATDDAEVAAAVRFIRSHACEGISVQQLVNHMLMSRSSLERRFRKALGKSPKAEILRIQLNRAKELLVCSSMSLARVAELSGFQSPNYFFEVFRKKAGTTPAKFRKQFSTAR